MRKALKIIFFVMGFTFFGSSLVKAQDLSSVRRIECAKISTIDSETGKKFQSPGVYRFEGASRFNFISKIPGIGLRCDFTLTETSIVYGKLHTSNDPYLACYNVRESSPGRLVLVGNYFQIFELIVDSSSNSIKGYMGNRLDTNYKYRTDSNCDIN